MITYDEVIDILEEYGMHYGRQCYLEGVKKTDRLASDSFAQIYGEKLLKLINERFGVTPSPATPPTFLREYYCLEENPEHCKRRQGVVNCELCFMARRPPRNGYGAVAYYHHNAENEVPSPVPLYPPGSLEHDPCKTSIVPCTDHE